MKEKILLIGEDPVLLATRASLLREWTVEATDTRGALAVMHETRFDVVIVGQLVTLESAKQLIAEAKGWTLAPEILVIRGSKEPKDLGVETHQVDLSRSPGWLCTWVRQALRERSAHSPVRESA